MSPDSAGEKTEKATPKKRKDARKEGQVLKSQDVTVAFCCVVIFALLYLIWPSYVEKMAKVFSDFLSEAFVVTASLHLDALVAEQTLQYALRSIGLILLPVMGTAVLAGLVINLLQVRFMFTTKPLMPKLSKISPLKGLKRLFSTQSVMQLLKSLLKIIVIGYLIYDEYQVLLVKFPALMGTNIYETFIEVMLIVFRLALKLSIVLVILAAFDFMYQRWKFEKDLKMTKQEIKDEYKNIEGDPQIKGKIKSKQRQMSAMRMMEKVPTADVVITNPTHYAIALKYEDSRHAAPVVLAKGQDYLARKIKEVAREHGVEVVEDKPLAQSLYQMCEVGDEIPGELYQAVADILVYVYRQKQRIRDGKR